MIEKNHWKKNHKLNEEILKSWVDFENSKTKPSYWKLLGNALLVLFMAVMFWLFVCFMFVLG